MFWGSQQEATLPALLCVTVLHTLSSRSVFTESLKSEDKEDFGFDEETLVRSVTSVSVGKVPNLESKLI